MVIQESLNVTFDESPPPPKTSTLVDDDLDKEKSIVENMKNLDISQEKETIKIDETTNIKESNNHPLNNIIGSLNQRTLRSQAQEKSNFFCFVSILEPKNVNEALKDEC